MRNALSGRMIKMGMWLECQELGVSGMRNVDRMSRMRNEEWERNVIRGRKSGMRNVHRMSGWKNVQGRGKEFGMSGFQKRDTWKMCQE